jgi:hypothetical protein
MSREQILDTLVYIGTRLRNSIPVEYFNNLMNTILSHNDPKEALILFMVHVRMMEKWGTIRSSIANEIINKVIETYNNTSDEEKYEILVHMRKYLPWIYESNTCVCNSFEEFIAVN